MRRDHVQVLIFFSPRRRRISPRDTLLTFLKPSGDEERFSSLLYFLSSEFLLVQRVIHTEEKVTPTLTSILSGDERVTTQT